VDALRNNVAALLTRLGDVKVQTEKFSTELRRRVDTIYSQLDRIDHAMGEIGTQNADLAAKLRKLEIYIDQANNAALGTQVAALEKAVLESLDYECRPVRYGTIHPAHKSTFDWVFSSCSESSLKTHHFLEWLESGSGLFWIRGKPGAGKSTLMKYITGNPRTKASLQTWANPDHAIIGSHYFWISGSPMQRSYMGLLRSIMFEILSQAPSLIEPLCRGESWWLDLVNCAISSPGSIPKWIEVSLLSCLRRLSAAKDLPVAVRFCVFIDALDEYAGHVNGEAKDFADICQTLLELTASTRMKICVASRPSNVFNDHFGTDRVRVLDVQELTTRDIARYARDGLKNLDWLQLTQNPVEDTPCELMESFVVKIQKQSQGIFLWVFLVVRLLRNGFTNGDSLQELQQRLESLPSDLEPFFKRISDDVEPCYHQKMAGFLRITLASQGDGLPFPVYIAHEYEYDQRRPLLDDLLCDDIKDKDHLELRARMAKRLDAITRGLLKFEGDNIHFLHRTVTDFLRTGPMMRFLEEKSHEHFTPHIATLRAVIAIWKIPTNRGLLAMCLSAPSEPDILEKMLRCGMHYISIHGPRARFESRERTAETFNQWADTISGPLLLVLPRTGGTLGLFRMSSRAIPSLTS